MEGRNINVEGHLATSEEGQEFKKIEKHCFIS